MLGRQLCAMQLPCSRAAVCPAILAQCSCTLQQGSLLHCERSGRASGQHNLTALAVLQTCQANPSVGCHDPVMFAHPCGDPLRCPNLGRPCRWIPKEVSLPRAENCCAMRSLAAFAAGVAGNVSGDSKFVGPNLPLASFTFQVPPLQQYMGRTSIRILPEDVTAYSSVSAAART